jgi:hypothetical protein
VARRFAPAIAVWPAFAKDAGGRELNLKQTNRDAVSLMKKIFLIAALVASLPLLHAGPQPKGFLVFEIDRYAYNAGNGAGTSDVKQSFKIPLTDDFMSNFKKLPIPEKSQGTGFCCSGGELTARQGTTRFMWWIHQTADRHWTVNMWAQGSETVSNAVLHAGNPLVSQDLRIKTLEDLDMHYLLSFNNMPVGLNVGFTAKYVGAESLKSPETVPTPPVQKADGSVLFTGDNAAGLPIKIHCSFQEN